MAGRERKAIHEHVKQVNAWLQANGPQKVVPTAGQLRRSADLAAAVERRRAKRAEEPYQGKAGHVPDTALTGMANPHSWQHMPGRSNSIIGGGWSSRIGESIDQLTINGHTPK